MRKFKEENTPDSTDFAVVGIYTDQYAEFIRFLDENDKEKEILKSLSNLRNQNRAELTKFDLHSSVFLSRICNKYATRLLLARKREKEALELLEFANVLLASPATKADPEAHQIKEAIRNNLAVYAFNIKDKMLAAKFLKSALRADHGARPEIRALLSHNLSMTYLKQSMIIEALEYNKEALSLIKPTVLEPIRKKINHKILQANKSFRDHLTIMLNVYLTKALIAEKMQESACNEDSMVSILAQLERSCDYSKLFLGDSHSMTLKLKMKINAIKKTKESRVSSHLQQDWIRKEESERIGRPVEQTQPNPKVFQKSRSVQLHANGKNAEDRLTNLLDSNIRNDSTSKDTSDTSPRSLIHDVPNTPQSKSNAPQTKGFRIRRSSLSGLQPLSRLELLMQDDSKKPDSSRQMPGRQDSRKNLLNASVDTEKMSQRNRSLNSSRFFQEKNNTSKSITSLDPGSSDEHKVIRKSVESMLKHQAKFEDNLTRKLENALANSHHLEPSEAAVIQKELELQIELLKKENERVVQAKLEKELELEKLRMELNNVGQAALLRGSMMPGSQFSLPSLTQLYNPYPNYPMMGPSQQVELGIGSQLNLSQHHFADSSYFAQHAFSHQPSGFQPIVRVPNRKIYNRGGSEEMALLQFGESQQQPKNVARSETFDVPMREELIIDEKIQPQPETQTKPPSFNPASKPTEMQRRGSLGIDDIPQIIVSKIDDDPVPVQDKSSNLVAQSDEGDSKNVENNFASAMKPKQTENPQIILTKEPTPALIESTNTNKSRDFEIPSKDNIKVSKDELKGEKDNNIVIQQHITIARDDTKPVKQENSITPQKESMSKPIGSSSISSTTQKPRKIGKYFDPTSRVFQLDFTKLEKKYGATEEERRTKTPELKAVTPEKKITMLKDTKQPSKPTIAFNKSSTFTPNAISNFQPPELGKSQSQNLQEKPPIQTQTKHENGRNIVSMASMNNPSLQLLSNKSKIEHVKAPPPKPVQQLPTESISKSQSSPPLDQNSKIPEIKIESAPNGTTGQDGFISLSALLEVPDYIKIPKSLSIRKQLVLLEDQYKYLIECKLEHEGNDPVLKMILSQKALTHDEYYSLAEEKMRIKQLKKILEILEYKDVIPTHMTIRSVNSLESLIKHFIIPFIGVSTDEEKNKKLEIWGKAPSILRGLPEIQFLGEECFLSLHHIANTDFRIVLTHFASGSFIRFDLNMDESSFARYFEWMKPITKQTHPIEDLMYVLDVVRDEETPAEELQKATRIIKKYQNADEVDVELDSCEIKKREEERNLLEFAINVISQIQTLFLAKGLTDFIKVCDMSSQFKYFKIRVFDEFKRTNFSILLENHEKGGIDVYLKNFFDTHAPKRKKVKAEGSYFYSFESIWKDFAMDYGRMNQDDKYSAFSLVSECFKLQTHEKEIDDEDAEMYEENSMVHIPVDLGTFSRTFIGDKYKTPITTVMVGIKGHPVGIKSCIFDNSQCIERGVFFYLSPHFWKIKEEENPPKKKRIKRHIIALPMIDQYNLEGILKFKGFDIIQRQLVFDEATSEINLLGVKSAGINAQSELLENVLCLNNFVKYFKEAKESELFEL